LAASIGAVAAIALVIGVPTALVPTSVFGRMTPAPWWSYPVWMTVSVLVGLAAVSGAAARPTRGRGGLMTVLAVGCPLCNKLVLAVLGSSGALAVWAPLQPVLALAALAIAARACWWASSGERTGRRGPHKSDFGGGQGAPVKSGAIRSTGVADRVYPAGRPRAAAER
jgi:hypothetical protein